MTDNTCIICHLEIEEGKDVLCECPNEHPVHEECLREWIPHSLKCPLCSEDYSPQLIAKCKEYLEKKAKEKEKSLEEKLKKQRLEQIEKIADDIIFLKFIDMLEDLIEKKEYDAGLEKLETLSDKKLKPDKSQKIQFLKGKIYYFKGRFDLAIGHLFKLVKEKFKYPDAFLYLGKSYQSLGLEEKARWAFERAK